MKEQLEFFGVFFGILGVGFLLVVHGTIFKTRWGVNLAGTDECPRCHMPRKLLRAPRNMRQRLWGGGTCEGCGLEVDKWNRPISS